MLCIGYWAIVIENILAWHQSHSVYKSFEVNIMHHTDPYRPASLVRSHKNALYVSPVHQSSPLVQSSDCRRPYLCVSQEGRLQPLRLHFLTNRHTVCDFLIMHGKDASKGMCLISLCLVMSSAKLLGFVHKFIAGMSTVRHATKHFS